MEAKRLLPWRQEGCVGIYTALGKFKEYWWLKALSLRATVRAFYNPDVITTFVDAINAVHTHTHIRTVRKVGTFKPAVKYIKDEYIHKSEDVAKYT